MNLLNEELKNIKYLFGYKPGKVISEQSMTPEPNDEMISILKELGFEKKFCNKSSRGDHGDVEQGWEYCNREQPDVDILISYPKPYDSIMIVDMKNLKKEKIDNATPYELETTLKRMFPVNLGMN
jgi:hypothetical protein